MDLPSVDRIAGLALQVHDLEAAARFYAEGLGFVRDGAANGRLRLRLGAQTIWLEAAAASPAPVAANDRTFQHFAVVVSDMAIAYGRVTHLHPGTISQGGPQRLPASSGGVTAWKFRGPDGRPLELLQTPSPAWVQIARRSPGEVFLGIDHTALGCADLDAGVAFYERLGLRTGPASHNRGPEQDRLDGLDDVDLQIATLFTPGAGPHIELLHYRRPASPADGAQPKAITTCFFPVSAATAPIPLRDADGHRFVIDGSC